jgi:flagellar biosynthesis/type III secretory pathway chaperone
MSRTSNPTVLDQALADEMQLTRQFRELLQRERDALTRGDLEQVFALANDKLDLATQLRKQADLRDSMLAVLGDGSIEPLAQWPLLAARWNALRAELAEAGEANRLNGLIVNSRLAAIGNAIAALRGTGDAPALYGRDGSTRASGAASGARWAA